MILTSYVFQINSDLTEFYISFLTKKNHCVKISKRIKSFKLLFIALQTTMTKNIELIFQNDDFIQRKLSEHIIENHFFDNKIITVEMILQMKKNNSQAMGDKKYGVVSSFGEMTEINHEARELISRKSFHQNNVVVAFITNNLAQRIMGNIYLKVYKPTINMKLFNNREKAIEWISEEIKKYL